MPMRIQVFLIIHIIFPIICRVEIKLLKKKHLNAFFPMDFFVLLSILFLCVQGLVGNTIKIFWFHNKIM